MQAELGKNNCDELIADWDTNAVCEYKVVLSQVEGVSTTGKVCMSTSLEGSLY